MPLVVDVPGHGRLDLRTLVADLNGTLTNRGRMLPGVAGRMSRLTQLVRVVLASADTFGTLAAIAAELGVEFRQAADAESKLSLLDELGRESTVMVGNGANDALALHAAGLAIAVLGPEGASSAALAAADVVCPSIDQALDLLLDERALVATLRR